MSPDGSRDALDGFRESPDRFPPPTDASCSDSRNERPAKVARPGVRARNCRSRRCARSAGTSSLLAWPYSSAHPALSMSNIARCARKTARIPLKARETGGRDFLGKKFVAKSRICSSALCAQNRGKHPVLPDRRVRHGRGTCGKRTRSPNPTAPRAEHQMSHGGAKEEGPCRHCKADKDERCLGQGIASGPGDRALAPRSTRRAHGRRSAPEGPR